MLTGPKLVRRPSSCRKGPKPDRPRVQAGGPPTRGSLSDQPRAPPAPPRSASRHPTSRTPARSGPRGRSCPVPVHAKSADLVAIVMPRPWNPARTRTSSPSTMSCGVRPETRRHRLLRPDSQATIVGRQDSPPGLRGEPGSSRRDPHLGWAPESLRMPETQGEWLPRSYGLLPRTPESRPRRHLYRWPTAGHLWSTSPPWQARVCSPLHLTGALEIVQLNHVKGDSDGCSSGGIDSDCADPPSVS